MNETEIQYMGKRLIERGFSVWFRTMFKLIEQTPFIVEPIHDTLFDTFDDIYSGQKNRVNINIPPRAGKTTLATYLTAFAITINPRSNIIYTSYSQSLLTDVANRLKDILENPYYKQMYNSAVLYEDEEEKPVDDFWAENLKRETGKNTYSSKKITTSKRGVCLFSSIGSQITGYGAGCRNSNNFSGALIIDDANKPDDTNHTVLRNKVNRYFSGTLLSRLNNSKTPIINIQQRLHIEDLSGYLIKKYNFETIKRPLITNDGQCLLPKQFTPERIKELQVDNYTFQAQYQQEPILLGGNIIKSEWFNYFDCSKDFKFKRVFITCDTAMKVKEHNDFSVFLVSGITQYNKLYIIDMLRGKWEAPELQQNLINLYKRTKEKYINCNAVYIEDKASGTGLIQALKRNFSIPVLPVIAEKDKLTRVENVLPYIQSGLVYLTDDTNINKDIIAECEQFTRDDTHLHDDIVDTLVYAIQVGLVKNKTMFDLL